MQPQEIHNYLLQYFQANNCKIVENNPNKMTVQLTIDLDKQLMNRPFYWHYIEKTDRVPEPAVLKLITNFHKANLKNRSNGEIISFGSPRLQQIFNSVQQQGAFIRLYEQQNYLTQTPLYPWLCLNVKVSYQCDLKKDVFYSFGLQLVNGKFVTDFYNYLCTVSLTPKIPDYSFTISPLIMPESGLKRIQNKLTTIIKEQDNSWAQAARQRWEKDLQLLNNFYEGGENKNLKEASYLNEKNSLQKQYEPKIIVSIVNGGLFYLAQEANF